MMLGMLGIHDIVYAEKKQIIITFTYVTSCTTPQNTLKRPQNTSYPLTCLETKVIGYFCDIMPVNYFCDVMYDVVILMTFFPCVLVWS